MTQPLDQADSIAFSFARVFSAMRGAINSQLLGFWNSLDSYRDSSIPEFLDYSTPLVEAARKTASSTQSAMIRSQLQVLGVDTDYFVDPDAIATDKVLRNGTSLSTVYSRPFTELWRLLSEGKDFDAAVQESGQRLRQLVETDLQLSRTHTSKDFFSNEPRVVGFRRVPTGTYTCALCLVASTQRYRSFDLMPIHPGCDCAVAPITSTSAGPRVIDQELLEQIHASVQKTLGVSARDAREVDYRKILVVHEHGELGPLMAKRGNKFTTL